MPWRPKDCDEHEWLQQHSETSQTIIFQNYSSKSIINAKYFVIINNSSLIIR